MGATLSSDHVNYLIWRYLQERGYGRAAVQLMRDWGVEPQNLDFAPAIKPNTLISILQDGLTYDELLAETLPRDLGSARPARQLSDASDDARRYSFVERRKRRASGALQNGGMEAIRKRPRLANGSRAVSTETMPELPQSARPGRRKSSFVMPHLNGDAMPLDEVDQPAQDTKPATPDEDVEMHMDEPSPPPIVSTLESGQNAGVQSEHHAVPVATTVADVVIADSDILHLAWSRSHPARLLVTGNRVFRTLTIPKLPPSDSSASEVESADHFGYLGPRLVTAVAPAPTDESIAVAVEEGELSLDHCFRPFDTSGAEHDMPLAERRVLRFGDGSVFVLRWSPSASYLLAINITEQHLTLAVFDTDGGHQLGDLCLAEVTALDAVWISDDHFLLCGGGFISIYRAYPVLQQLHKLTTRETWTFVRWDQATGVAACAAEADGILALLEFSLPKTDDDNVAVDENADARRITESPALTITHTALQPGPITALEWQPLQLIQSNPVQSIPESFDEPSASSPNAMDIDITVPISLPESAPVSVPATVVETVPEPVSESPSQSALQPASESAVQPESDSMVEQAAGSVSEPEQAAELLTEPTTSKATSVTSITTSITSPLKPRLLATSSTDGTVTIYSASPSTGLSTLHTFVMGQSPLQTFRSVLALAVLTVPAVAMAFSPDGVHVAAAGEGRICVWRADAEGKPVCVWDEEEEDGESIDDNRARALVIAAADHGITTRGLVDDSTVAEITVNGHGETFNDTDADAEGDIDDMVIELTTATMNGDGHEKKQQEQQGQEQPGQPKDEEPEPVQGPPQTQIDEEEEEEQQQLPQQQEQELQLPPPSGPRPEPFCTLAWDVTGSRLSFGRGDRLRVIALELPGVTATAAAAAAAASAAIVETAAPRTPIMEATEVAEMASHVETTTAPVAMMAA